MTTTLATQSDASALLRWCTLVERVYQQLDAVMATGSASGPSLDWDALLTDAAEYFDLERLVLSAGPAPPRTERSVLAFPVAPAAATSGSDDAPLGPATSPAAQQRHLTAYLKRKSRVSPSLTSRLARFVEHLEHCLQLQHLLESERRALDRVGRCLDEQATATVLCDARGRVAHTNRAASELARRVPGLHLGPGTTRFLSGGGGRDMLELLFARAQEHESAACHWELSLEGLLFTLIALTPRSVGEGVPGGAALGLVIQEQATSAGRAQSQRSPLSPPPAHLQRRLRERFDLTEKEIQLAHALAMGLSIGTYARRCQRSPHTLRNQVKSIFMKLHARSQKEVILRVWQERQAAWLECAKLILEDHELAIETHMLLYPVSQASRSHGSVTPGQVPRR